ncbi:Cation/H(+) antiporter like [Melia azedarach]|uniref:Cation/H(+) antiporter like n=1 Tax=Melia azedarach TaxID=155640 RepID=A0ACC1Y5V9_MELAZ|nr:Cation/H(+) antiporter like [Melia azedarach]
MSNPQALNNITDYKLMNNTVTCEYSKIRNSNEFGKHRILNCTTAVLLMQTVLIFTATRTIYLLLRPFHQTTIIAQIIAGIIIGPSFLGEIAYLQWLFPLPSRYILRTVAEFGMILHNPKELNILSSELGRLASSTALVADLFRLTANMLLTSIKDAHNNSSFKPLLFINPQIFTILVTNMVFITGIATAIVGYIYDPSRRYKLDARRTIIRSKQSNLRILVCINSNENVSPIISLLEVSNPSRNTPLTAFVLQLRELKGSVTAFLKPHHQRTDSLLSSSRHIINAFNKFQRCYLGNVVVQHFTTIAPYESMDDDICTLAFDKSAAIIIIPFHKQWAVSIGTVEESDLSIRALNDTVLSNAPCSVGVLVHRGQIKGIKPKFSGQLLYHIALLFIGGADDREALAYSRRIAEHPNIRLTIVWFKTHDSNILAEDVIGLDNEVINELKASVVGKKIIFKEEVVKNGLGTIEVIQSLKNNHDLFIVGKHHEPDSQVIWGLSEWIEYPELGIVGDTLVNSNDKFSVLVVQEQPEEIGPKLKHLESGSKYRKFEV